MAQNGGSLGGAAEESAGPGRHNINRSQPMNVTTALVELVREALKDPSIRSEIKAIVLEGQPASSVPAEDEALVDAQRAAKLLGMSAVAVRAAAFRGTLPSHHIGRRLRFRPSELLPERRSKACSSR